ncbi:MAG: TetR/AcrR family transcriptional regulator [Actinobacteria bacterium]|nr:TetR/AcrR family transcriptional regulator [Actinomycetota bacterium]
MGRRLTPAARRAEIIETTQAAIASEGYRTLSLREIARRCGLSAPGLMHYFPDMPTLLAAVLDHRDEVDFAAFFPADRDDVTLAELMERGRDYYAGHPSDTGRFDALESEALDPTHPAHDYFTKRNERTIERMRPQVEREFEDPDEVLRILGLVLDGLRIKRLRAPEVHRDDDDADWRAMLWLLDRLPHRRSDETAG